MGGREVRGRDLCHHFRFLTSEISRHPGNQLQAGVFSHLVWLQVRETHGFRMDSNSGVEARSSRKKGECFAGGGCRSVALAGVGVLGTG